MPIRAEEQVAIIELLSGLYARILPIEAEWGIRQIEGDMRPRIEYFHDAVRAFSAGERPEHKGSRLSVEHIAYDIAQMHAIQEKPLGLLNRATQKSPSGALIKTGAGLMAQGAGKTPPVSVRSELKMHYKNYTVFFTALLTEPADRNYFSRCEEMDETLADIGLIETILKQLSGGRLSQAQAQGELEGVAHDTLRTRMQGLLARKTVSAREKQEAVGLLQEVEKGVHAQRSALDKRHLQMATTKMNIFHDSKDVVKDLMQNGLNVAGKFLQASMQQASGKGRGV